MRIKMLMLASALGVSPGICSIQFGGTAEPAGGGTPSQPTTDAPADNTGDAAKDRLDQGADNKVDEGQTYDASQAAPTAKDLGLDVDKAQTENPASDPLREVAAADAGVGSTKADQVTGEVVYSSHPVQNYHVGPYHFENTILRLKPDQVADFETLIEGLPAADRLNIRKIDVGVAEGIIAARTSANNTATRAFDSSVGRAAMQQLQAGTPVVGTENLESLGDRMTVGFDSDPGSTGNDPALVAKPTSDGTEAPSDNK